jgi:WD40-like Beta Propeller Repeat
MSRIVATFVTLGLATVMGVAMPAWAQRTTERASVSSGGVQGNGYSIGSSLSADGRFVGFYSEATTLVAGDTNNADDIFIRNRKTGITERIVISGGGQTNGGSRFSVFSAEGRFVAFDSEASNLVPNDTNGVRDVFIRDRKTGTTERISVSLRGIEGSYGGSNPSISKDGRFVVFSSEATNLIAANTNSVASDVFIRDRKKATTELVSVSSGGVQGNAYSIDAAISADGRFVAFRSFATNLVTNDTNDADDVFVRDLKTDTTERVSVNSDGGQGNGFSSHPAISANGRFVAFESTSYNLVPDDANAEDVFVRDRQTGTTERVNLTSDDAESNGYGTSAAISADGRFVAFLSAASNLVADDTNAVNDIFVRDRQTGTTERIVNSAGIQGNGDSFSPVLSADGHFVAFTSDATNLAPGDTNGVRDIFVHSLAP